MPSFLVAAEVMPRFRRKASSGGFDVARLLIGTAGGIAYLSARAGYLSAREGVRDPRCVRGAVIGTATPNVLHVEAIALSTLSYRRFAL